MNKIIVTSKKKFLDFTQLNNLGKSFQLTRHGKETGILKMEMKN